MHASCLWLQVLEWTPGIKRVDIGRQAEEAHTVSQVGVAPSGWAATCTQHVHTFLQGMILIAHKHATKHITV